MESDARGQLLDGKALAKQVREDLTSRVGKFVQSHGRAPGLAVILVGDDPASAVYVGHKEKAAKKVGLLSEIIRLPADTSQSKLEGLIDQLNERDDIDGFMVQMPLPKHLDADAALLRINPNKDPDGLHPTNLGKLATGLTAPRSCTPHGVMQLLAQTGIELEGAHAVVVGRSAIVGKPMALMLLEKNATVTMCHSRTKNLAEEVGRADVVVVAVGRANMVQGDWIKDGAVVVDVGMNRLESGLVGDVDFEAARPRASWITPVPGGVGPMTVAMLLSNTVDIAERAVG